MGKKVSKYILALLLACSCVIPMRQSVLQAESTKSEDATSMHDYKLYPKPHSIAYKDGSYIMQEGINVVYDEGIDAYTKQRLEEVAALKKLNVSTSEKEMAGKTNVFVGIYDSNGNADTYIKAHATIDPSLFSKTDAYFMSSNNGTISILGKDSDASFYGLTTLYQIFAQLDSYRIRNFEVQDYADVKSRGFIEGYYGNPWSLEDRIDLMKFGGYYKMNSYFYAPKDDPKHNAKWRELYTADELKNIKALADAGNASKCRFVFALHPFMSNPVRFDTEENYQNDLKILQAKFKQVIDNGVREIAILDDDAAVPGGNPENSIRLLKDMTSWLKDIQKEYPDMKLTLPFVPSNYGGDGSGNELQTLKKAPDNVQIVMTGGKVWGEVSKNFTETYHNNMGSGPFMWINWPCTDNSKKHLIMGGNSTFLHPGVDPAKIQGIMLNPMQQSEPSKVAILANATYSWNIWGTNEEADQAWEDAFSFVDHNTANETEASDALRELSKHMINQNMDSRVTPLQESVELKKLLTSYKEKLNNGVVTAEETNAIIHEFEILQKAAKTYRNNAGDMRTRDQIVYWLDCWDDTTTAAIAYLKGIKASLLGDTSNAMRYNSEGQQAFDKSKKHGFYYVDHTEYAEVGVQHIVPFISATGKYLNTFVKGIIDPSIVSNKFITNRTDTSVGDINNVFDGKDDTFISFQNPATIAKDDYVGVTFSKKIDVQTIRFLLGGGKNHFDQAKLQYTTDGTSWQDLESMLYDGVLNKEQEVNVAGLHQQAKGIRLIATKNNANDAWLDVKEIQINKPKEESDAKYNATASVHGLSVQSEKPSSNIMDGDITSEAFFAKDPYSGADRDTIGVNADVTLTFDRAKPIGKVYIAQGYSAAGDVLSNAALEYKNTEGVWIQFATVNSGKEQTFDVSRQNIQTKQIRIRNLTATKGWWRLGEIQVYPPTAQADDTYVYTNTTTDILSKAEANKVMLKPGSVTLKPNDYIGIELKNIRGITNVDATTIPEGCVLQTSMNGLIWDTYDASKQPNARYIRVVNNNTMATTMNVQTFSVTLFELTKPKLLECTTPIAPGWGNGEDMRVLKNDGNLFDGNLATGAEIGGLPTKGEYAIFDLGQSRTFTSFRYYVVETQANYLRDGVFEVADSPDATEWTPILTVGDGIENVGSDDANRTAKNYSEFTHDSKNPGNMYKEAVDLKAKGRYIRLRFTADNKNRAVYINELQINGGEYVSDESNRDVIAECIEEQGKEPSNMFDHDISTVYKPSKPNSSFTYYLSDPKNVKTIRFAQNGEVSDVTVVATLLHNTTTRSAKSSITEDITLGTLDQSLKEFRLPNDTTLLSVKVSWKDKIPELSEILTTSNDQEPDKHDLEAEINNPVDANWTKDTTVAYTAALKVANEVVKSPYASQESVTMALGGLQAARSAALVKADGKGLQALVDAYRPQNKGNIEMYSTSNYVPYAVGIADGKRALKDVDNLSDKQNTQLVKAIKDAEKALSYSTIQIELATVTLANDATKYAEDSYTTNSYKAYSDANQALKTMVADDATTRQAPDVVNTTRTGYAQAVEGLVNIGQLSNLVNDFAKYNKDLYTTDSYNAYQKAVDDAKALLTNGTKEQVEQAIHNITEDVKALTYKSMVTLRDVITEMERLNKADYTETSFTTLATILANAKRDMVQNSDNLNKTYIQTLSVARNQLVDARAYKAEVAKAKAYKATEYTKDSFLALQQELTKSTALLQSGTAAQLLVAVTNMEQAIYKLLPLAKDLPDYQKAISKKDATLYTKESYARYVAQYEIMMNLPMDNTSVTKFQAVRSEFEKAELSLVMKDADYRGIKDAISKVSMQMPFLKSDSVKALQAAINAIQYDLPITQQNKIDTYTNMIEALLRNAVYKDADYTRVDSILKKVPTDLTGYSDASVKALQDAIHAINYNRNMLQQQQVDAYVTAIQKALDHLVIKNTKGTSDVKTYDTTSAGCLMIVIVLAVASLIVVMKKRKPLHK